MKLYHIILGATPKGRNIEQHDIFFGIAENFADLIPDLKAFWSDAKIHVDCYKEVRFADGYEVKIVEKTDRNSENQLFFINLGGYKPNHFLEYHEQHLMVGKTMCEVIQKVKQTDFYKNMGFKGAESHVDDKHGVDIDDIYEINDLLPKKMKEKYSIILENSDAENQENFMKIGYMKINQ